MRKPAIFMIGQAGGYAITSPKSCPRAFAPETK
jgi:hypothetical protein